MFSLQWMISYYQSLRNRLFFQLQLLKLLEERGLSKCFSLFNNDLLASLIWIQRLFQSWCFGWLWVVFLFCFVWVCFVFPSSGCGMTPCCAFLSTTWWDLGGEEG